jgi:hypothetical protein
MKPLTIALAALPILALAACSRSAPAPAAPVAAASSAAPASPAQADSAAGAKAAATAYFDLYAARQYGAGYQLLTPSARRAVTKGVWVKVHDECRGGTQLAYKVTRPVLAGTAAVVNVSLAGAASKIGSEEQTFAYRGGRWLFEPSDISAYRHGGAARVVARLRAQGLCS